MGVGQSKKEVCTKGHPLSGTNLQVYRGKRVCKACAALRSSSYRKGFTSVMHQFETNADYGVE